MIRSWVLRAAAAAFLVWVVVGLVRFERDLARVLRRDATPQVDAAAVGLAGR